MLNGLRFVADDRLPGGSRLRFFGTMAIALFLGLIALSSGCHETDEFTLPPPFFVPSGTAAKPDKVRLLQGPNTTTDSIEVAIVIGGPTTSSDIYSFVFDLELADPTFLEYIDNSATAGDALDGLTPLVEVAQVGDRVVVGVTKYGAVPGNGVPSGERTIVTLRFRVPQDGGSTLHFAGSTSVVNPSTNPVALDSAGQVVPSVGFDAVDATISR